ncbi:MAG: Uncharacterized protein Greene041619_587 [Candidatus Peregrinibacteria bacterium Greene0416_19]|nr:MAG: Uncharacterized protein Greene041619_587 [Candidatus Peregrinibacteria bacterium Greene0416_19]
MTPREIIAEAWAITKRGKQLRRWGVFSSFLETLLSLKLLSYQIYFLWQFFTGYESGFFDVEIAVAKHFPLWFTVIFIGGFLLLMAIEWVMPHLATGAIIGLAAKSHRKEDDEGGFVLALYNFFPIFVTHEFFVFGSTSLLITFCSVVLRYIDGNIKILIILFAIGIWAFTNVLGFLSSFAPAAIVVQKKGIFEAIGQSFKLIVSHLSHVMFLLLLLLVISLRVALNAAVVLLVPGLVIGLGLLLAMFFSPVVSYTAASIVGMGLILLASYFFGYLHVFKETVWTITYMELKKKKDLDVIEG